MMIRACILAMVAGVMTSVVAPAQDRLQDQLQSLVTLYLTTAENRIKVGTGFVVKPGTVATAYHVVCGGRSVEAVGASGATTRGVTILNLLPEKDLAILEISDFASLPPFHIERRVPPVEEDLFMLGSAAQIPKSTYTVRLVQSRLVQIASFNDTDGKPLLERPPNTEVLQVAGIIYGGISGGPLVDRRGAVIGVLSGSLSEGGSFGWAIPSRDLDQSLANLPTRRRFDDRVAWPPIPFRTASLRSVEYFVRRDAAAQNEFDNFTSRADRLHSINNQIAIDGGLFSWNLAEDAIAIRTILTSPRGAVIGPVTVKEINESFPVTARSAMFSSNWGNLSVLRKNLIERYSVDRGLRTLVSRLGEVASRPDLDPKSAERIRRVSQQVAASDPEVASNTFERRQGVDTLALIEALDKVLDRRDFKFSSITQAEQYVNALQSCVDWLNKYTTFGPFGEWVPKEKVYFDQAAEFLRRFRPVVVYVPE